MEDLIKNAQQYILQILVGEIVSEILPDMNREVVSDYSVSNSSMR